jgi:hypothetical protein
VIVLPLTAASRFEVVQELASEHLAEHADRS